MLTGLTLISIVIPSRGRPDRYHKARDTWFNTASNLKQIELLCLIDDNDKLALRYGLNPNGYNETIYQHKDMTINKKMNWLARKAKGDLIISVGDSSDMKTPGWDEIVIEVYKQLPDPYIITVFNELHKHRSASVYTKEWRDVFGGIYEQAFNHFMGETFVFNTAIAAQRFYAINNIYTEHFHVKWGNGISDATHKRPRFPGFNEQTNAINDSLQPKLQSNILLLKQLIKDSPPIPQIGNLELLQSTHSNYSTKG